MTDIDDKKIRICENIAMVRLSDEFNKFKSRTFANDRDKWIGVCQYFYDKARECNITIPELFNDNNYLINFFTYSLAINSLKKAILEEYTNYGIDEDETIYVYNEIYSVDTLFFPHIKNNFFSLVH